MNFREKIFKQLKSRNERTATRFGTVLRSYNELLEMVIILKHNQGRFRRESTSSGAGESNNSQQQNGTIHLLEKKLNEMQSELTELYRRRGENAQGLIDANRKLEIKEAELSTLREKLETSDGRVDCLTSTNYGLEEKLNEMEKCNEHLKNEYIALQTAYNSLEARFREMSEENQKLIGRLLDLRQKEADVMNLENTWQQKLNELKLQTQIAEAAKEQIVVPIPVFDAKTGRFDSIESENGAMPPPTCVGATVPHRCKHKFEAHESDVNAIMWTPRGKYLATGGVDRKIKLWDVSERPRCLSRFDGCNSTVMCLDFNADETLILAGCNDFAVRLWTVSTQRSFSVFNGHSNKVFATKFVGTTDKIVSGSHDRTLKVWDLRARCAFKTLFAASICNDLVTSDGGPGACIISGHYDKKLRFWDIRSEQATNEISMSGKITSLDLSTDRNYLLCCTRDEALQNLDLRTNRVVNTFTHEGFKVGFDYTRCVFSPDVQFCAAGSADGVLYVWNVQSGKVEAMLAKEHESSITAVAWHPSGQGIASCDKHKTVCFWADF